MFAPRPGISAGVGRTPAASLTRRAGSGNLSRAGAPVVPARPFREGPEVMSMRLMAGIGGLGLALAGAAAAAAGEPPRVDRQVNVYREAGRFAGWPANHGIW